jgi:hypothetical protein
MKYDFVEIGTSNFDTLIEQATDTTRGISIEAIKYYLDCLPDRPGVKKLNVAVSRNNVEEMLQVFYVPESVIKERNLPDWLRGCNSVGDYHYQHGALEIKDLVVKTPVPCVPIGQIFDEYEVTELDYLKLDTEGSDAEIMLHFYEYIVTKPKTQWPRRVLFESNQLNPINLVVQVRNKFAALGYHVTCTVTDTILEIKE